MDLELLNLAQYNMMDPTIQAELDVNHCLVMYIETSSFQSQLRETQRVQGIGQNERFFLSFIKLSSHVSKGM